MNNPPTLPDCDWKGTDIMQIRPHLWKIMSTLSFFVSAVMLYNGFYKMLIYDNGEGYGHDYINAYVGGDTYNYIINGNYATGFFVLATLFVILGIGIIIIHYLAELCQQRKALPQNVQQIQPQTISETSVL